MVRKRHARIERKRERRKTDIERAWLLHKAHIDALRLAWLAAHVERQKRRCAYCGITMLTRTTNRTDPRRATLDHLVARAKGGADALENTVAACMACNTSKGDMDAERFRQIRMSTKADAL